MTTINKQKFLAELGKLLTFMYEEDRQAALAMYNRMFDATEDDKALLQYLGSPTKQAVVIARSYDAKECKLQVTAQARNEDSGDGPECHHVRTERTVPVSSCEDRKDRPRVFTVPVSSRIAKPRRRYYNGTTL